MTVWSLSSLLVQTTVSPAFTVSLGGSYLRFLIAIFFCLESLSAYASATEQIRARGTTQRPNRIMRTPTIQTRAHRVPLAGQVSDPYYTSVRHGRNNHSG